MELWDIYDSEKRPTGRTMKRNDWTMKDGDYHLTVLAAIMHPDGKFLITQRIMTKAWAAGHWEIPGGGVRAGETSEAAIRREVMEETGLDISKADGGLAFTYRRDNPEEDDNYFVDVYRYTLDFSEGDVRLQTEESTDFRLASADEIQELANDGIFLHYNSIKQIFELN